MPVPVPETLASPELARRCDEPWPQDSAQADTRADSQAAPHPEKPHREMPRAEMPHREIDGPGGPEPTRYGDWERRGRCIDF